MEGTRGQGQDFWRVWSAPIRAAGRDLWGRRQWGLAGVTSDLSSLSVCRCGPQAPPTKDSVAFQPQSNGKGGTEDEQAQLLHPRTQATGLPWGVRHPPQYPVRLRWCLGRRHWTRYTPRSLPLPGFPSVPTALARTPLPPERFAPLKCPARMRPAVDLAFREGQSSETRRHRLL